MSLTIPDILHSDEEERRIIIGQSIEALSIYPDRTELFNEYPELESEDIRQVLAYAALTMDDTITMLDEAA